MVTLTSRPYAGAADIEPLIDLLLLCRTIAGLDPWPPIREIRRHLCAATQGVSADTGSPDILLIWATSQPRLLSLIAFGCQQFMRLGVIGGTNQQKLGRATGGGIAWELLRIPFSAALPTRLGAVPIGTLALHLNGDGALRLLVQENGVLTLRDGKSGATILTVDDLPPTPLLGAAWRVVLFPAQAPGWWACA